MIADSHSPDAMGVSWAEGHVAVANQVTGRFVPGESVRHLTCNPLGSRMVNKDLPYVGWDTHKWRTATGRRLKIASGDSVLQRHCTNCAREFVIFESSRTPYAIYPSAVSFYRLADDVTEHWLKEPCPGKHLPRDDDDRQRRVAELVVSD